MMAATVKVLALLVVLAILIVAVHCSEESQPSAAVAVPSAAGVADPEAPAKLPGEEAFYKARSMLYRPDRVDDVQDAVRLLHEAADSGYAAAQSLLGTMHAYGIGVPRNEALAVLFHTFAAMNGNVESNVVLTHRKFHGIGADQSCSGAATHAKFAADAVARGFHAEFAPAYETARLGDGRTKDVKANHKSQLDIQLFHAEKGDAKACTTVGLAYLYGTFGAPQDAHKAVQYLTKAVREGDVAAYGVLGQIYAFGIETADPPIPQDRERAIKLFNKGAEAKKPSAAALNGLGYMHAAGVMNENGVHDWDKAKSFFQRAAEVGNAEALYNLGVLHLNGRGVPRDLQAAQQLFNQARAAGSLLAKYQLANMILFGLGETRSRCADSVRLFAETFERGRWRLRSDAALRSFERGEYGAALLDYLILADQGVATAMHNAAHILSRDAYTDGILFLHQDAVFRSTDDTAPSMTTTSAFHNEESAGSRDPGDVILHALLWRSVHLGQKSAHLTLGDNYFYGRGVAPNLRRAEEHYMQAAQAGYAQGHFNVALTYENGSPFTTQDFYLAKRHYDSAAASEFNAKWVVTAALVRMNFKWWLSHFGIVNPERLFGAFHKVTRVAPESDVGAASELLDSGGATGTAGSDVQDHEAEEDHGVLHSLGNSVEEWMPEIAGYGLDTLILGATVVAALVLLFLRHDAAVM